MRDKDSQLIFENYLNLKNNIILENDEKKWEDESSVWFWLKTLDPTGFSSWPDVEEAWYGVEENPADIGPWAFLILQFFLALPNFGLLAAGIGGIGWAALRVTAKAAIKAGPRSPAVYNIAEKILKYATETKWFQAILLKFAETLRNRGVKNENLINTLEDLIVSGNFEKLGSKGGALAIAAKETIGDGIRQSVKIPGLGIPILGTGGQIAQYGGRAGMAYKDDVKAEIEKIKQNIDKKRNKGQGPTNDAAATGKYPVDNDRTATGKYPVDNDRTSKSKETPFEAEF